MGGADWLIESLLLPPTLFGPKPWVLAMSGHAAVGKTGLAEGVVRRSANAVRLETECCILDLDERIRLGVSGCAVEAHDLALFARYIERLLDGQTVTFRAYDWKTRGRTGEAVEKTLPSGGVLVLDGTIACHPDIAAYCDKVVFLKPADYEQWIEFAVDRDIRERWRSRSVAIQENRAKYLDTSNMESAYRASITDIVSVEIPRDLSQGLVFRPHLS